MVIVIFNLVLPTELHDTPPLLTAGEPPPHTHSSTHPTGMCAQAHASPSRGSQTAPGHNFALVHAILPTFPCSHAQATLITDTLFINSSSFLKSRGREMVLRSAWVCVIAMILMLMALEITRQLSSAIVARCPAVN